MTKKVIVVCEGKSDFTYLNALQRFIDNEIALPPGEDDSLLRFVPYPEEFGTGTGAFDRIIEAYRQAVVVFENEPVEIWVDADIYIRNAPLHSDETKFNGTEYLNRPTGIPTFKFSYHNFEDFIALHCDDEAFAEWKRDVLAHISERTRQSHHDSPLVRAEYAVVYNGVFTHYAKRKMPFPITVERLANLRRHLADPDVNSMAQLLRPGIQFGEFLLALFDVAYPGLIP